MGSNLVQRNARRTAGRRIAALALLASCAISLPALAVVYKWTDASGRVVYSSVPPPGDVKVERVQTPAPADPDALRRMNSQDAELKKRQLDREQEAEKAERARADATRRDEMCGNARGQIKALSNDNLVVERVNPQGERVTLDVAARKKERERLEQFVRTECVAASAAR